MKNLELIALLRGCVPEVNKGRVTLLREGADGVEQDVTAEIAPDEAYLDAHPEGSDRGGYVPFVEKGGARAFFYDLDGTWQS